MMPSVNHLSIANPREKHPKGKLLPSSRHYCTDNWINCHKLAISFRGGIIKANRIRQASSYCAFFITCNIYINKTF